MKGYMNLKKLIEPNYPGLFDSIQNKIKKVEKEYEKPGEKDQDSFLWEHSVFVAAVALKICLIEEKDPFLPVIAALFHDIGKFEGGRYHDNNIPEEKISARIAVEMMASFGLKKSDIDMVTAGLLALYDKEIENNSITDIIYDADFLSKSGYLGVANFFLKSAIRGQNLYTSLSRNLSRELTYASVLPGNMKTLAGKKLAVKKSRDLRLYFEGIIQELRDLDIVRFEKREETLPCPQKTGKDLKFVLVFPETCPSCAEGLSPEYSFVQGIKCTELSVLISCVNCPSTIRMSFCLPEILPE